MACNDQSIRNQPLPYRGGRYQLMHDADWPTFRHDLPTGMLLSLAMLSFDLLDPLVMRPARFSAPGQNDKIHALGIGFVG